MGSKIDSKILEHAIKCFAATGYHGTTTREIAAAANVTEGSVFRLFHSKEGLFEEVIKSAGSTQMTGDELAELLKREGDFREVLFSAIWRWYRRLSPEYVRLAMFANLSAPKLASKAIYERVGNLHKALADAVDRRNERRCGSRESLNSAKHFMFGLFYYKLTRATMKDSAPERYFVENTVDAWLRCFDHCPMRKSS